MLSEVALYWLCIPANSAPLEKGLGFSVPGLTIAKNWARLALQNANELIFLHVTLPAINNYEESGHAQSWIVGCIRDQGYFAGHLLHRRLHQQ